jgi:hypothetical protein
MVMMVFFASCVIDRYGTGLPDALKKVTPTTDTICIEEVHDFFRVTKPIHIHCFHDKTKNP